MLLKIKVASPYLLAAALALIFPGRTVVAATVAQSGVSVTVTPPWVNIGVSKTQQFTAIVTGTSNTAVTWAINEIPGGNSTIGTISTQGIYTAPPSTVTVSVTATSVADRTRNNTVTAWVQTGAIVNVFPKTATIAPGQSLPIFATVTGTTNTGLSWHVAGGAGNGTVTNTGLYTAPAKIPSPSTVSVVAVSWLDSNVDVAQVTIAGTAVGSSGGSIPSPGLAVSVSPPSATLFVSQSQQFTATVGGASNTGVTWSVNGAPGGNSTVGTVSSTGLYTAPSAAPSPTTVTITATSTANGTTPGTAVATIAVPAPPVQSGVVSVAVAPAAAALSVSQQQQFTATLTGTSNTAVTWSVNGIAGGNSALGIISSAGLYTAPAAAPSPNAVTVKATSAADTTKSASATITINSPVTFATTSLPGGTVGLTYSFTLAASGGTAPYTWLVTGGSLPAGISLSSSGVLSGKATSASSLSPTIQVTDANGHSASLTFSITIAAASGSSLQILTNDLHMATVQQPYAAVLTGSAGVAPYTWSAGSALPPGLTLAANGQISGTPTQGGLFPVTLNVTDSKGATGSKTFSLEVFEQPVDQYGGLTSLPCGKGPQAHFYTQKIGSRWHLCTPAGNAFWMNGVYYADASDSGTDYQGISLANVVNAKYASGFTGNSTLNWGLQTVRRMQSWGFNTVAEYANIWTLPTSSDSDWGTPDSFIPVKLPFVGLVTPSLYTLTNVGSYANGPVKDLIYGIKSAVFSGYRSSSPDVWDPNFAQWLQGELANDVAIRQAYSGKNNDYLIGINVDDTDNLQGFGAGPDFPTTANGVAAPGYNQLHLGWAILVTAPTQSSNSSQGVSYTNATVYAKQELSNWLAARYNNSIASLNSAWGSNYSTFGSSGGFGAGTGLLDEDGTHSWVPKDPYALSDANATMKQDLNDFLLHHAQQYFSVIKNALQKAAPGVLYLGPTVLGTWGGVPFRQSCKPLRSTWT